MTASQIGYGDVATRGKSYLNGTQRTVLSTVAWVILCLLVAQRVTPAPWHEPSRPRCRAQWTVADFTRTEAA
ncbi:MAG: hypothetical protein M1118_11670 [Chloroflexi bacterium]|nr:hypothetical protein [Chloroflexota bacterium]